MFGDSLQRDFNSAREACETHKFATGVVSILKSVVLATVFLAFKKPLIGRKPENECLLLAVSGKAWALKSDQGE